MRVLVVGGGGREHALVWKLSQSPRIGALFCAPGNGGISRIASCVGIEASDTESLLRFSKREGIEFVVVGPETALAAGIVDVFENAGIRIFGPNRRGSQIETSKVFAKELMNRYGVPTASFRTFSDFEGALSHIRDLSPPYVVKADGLCAGKGAYVVREHADGEAALRELLVQQVHGEAGKRVVIEEFLPGVEASYLAFSDGSTIIPMLPSQDHKALLDGDGGPNTGGMGAYTPVSFIDNELGETIDLTIMKATIEGLRNEGIVYKGVLYGGLMLNNGAANVVEFNARFGDPETQPIVAKMASDLLPILVACAEGRLANIDPIIWRTGVALCVVVVSRGYPGKSDTGKVISGLEDLEGLEDTFVFHAGTKRIGNRLVTSGGRVLGVTVLGRTYSEAISKAYEAVAHIRFEGMYFRTDIGKKAPPMKAH